MALTDVLFVTSHEGPIPSAAQKRGVHERVHHFAAYLGLNAEQSARLRRRELKSGHFPKLGADTIDEVIKVHARLTCREGGAGAE